jgi:SAM-dependent methyltransferase
MELLDKANIFRFHNDLISRFGAGTTAALGWNEPAGQQIRYKILSGIGQLDHHSVLDAGCGHGDMYEYLIELYPQLRYYGVEQIPHILKEALDRYSHLPNTYYFEGDFSAADLPMVDYVIACGSLNYRNSDKLFVLKTIEKLFDSSRIGLGFNLLQKIDPPDGFLEAYNPVYITEFCRKLTSKVTLIEDYYGEDYTVFMYH